MYPNLSTVFFLASLGKQLCGSRKASLLLCPWCSSVGADGSNYLSGLSFLAAMAKREEITRYFVFIF